MENDETKLEAALREVKEETNLDIKERSDKPVYLNKYKIKRGRQLKKVHYFAGIAHPGDIKLSKEHKRYFVLVPSQARDTLTHTGDKNALDEALNWLETTDKIEN